MFLVKGSRIAKVHWDNCHHRKNQFSVVIRSGKIRYLWKTIALT
jgi:hypothetical protein